MSLNTTYPGVYVIEKSSGVHTITGVATSITAFLGFTTRGPVDEPVHIFSFADFERAFGGVSVDSPLSHAVRHFYTNGGSEAYVVRVAHDAKAASVELKDTDGNVVLELTASSEGTWGNNLRVDVDYATANPASLFNTTVTELVDQNGQLVVGRTESFLNLSMDDHHPSYAVNVLNARSDLVDAERAAGLAFGAATSTSAVLTVPDVTAMPAGYRVAYTLNGQGPFEAEVLVPSAPAGNSLADGLAAIVADLNPVLPTVSPGVSVGVFEANALRFTTTDATEHASLHFLDASKISVTARLKLGTGNGGTEIDGAAGRRPAQTGALTDGGGTSNAATSGSVTVEVRKGETTAVKTGIPLSLWNPPAGSTGPSSPAELVALLNAAFTEVGRSEPLLRGTRAMLVGTKVRLVPPSAEPDLNLRFAGGVTTTLKLNNANVTNNVAAYAPGRGTTAFAQVAGTAGNNGTPPIPAELSGSATLKTGIYALDDVDLFNLMVIPDATMGAAGMQSVLTDAIAYCERRRAFMIIDVPEMQNTFAMAKTWVDNAATPLRSRNSALFFPRLRMPNPLNPTVLGTYGAAGALAGLFARTDAERGVWKAPAGISAKISGASGLAYKLTDAENGVLNPLGINSLRVFPVHGTVSWGSRTGRGADTLADEYKYIPVRRLALFLEESLYRGTQWVVFEPNDEPLWAQVRLNLGAFMHELYAQGAFKGTTPRQAYFVKCDSETTTQNDIDLGRVNVVVGFAPLKPAEFVILTIQQIAGNILT